MKRVLLTTTILLLVLAFAAFAAEPAPEAGKGLVGYGLKAGLQLANLSGSGADSLFDISVTKKMKIGFGGGAFLTYGFSPMFAIQPEILYVMKGAKFEAGGETAKVKADYLQVPVLLKLSPQTQGKIKPYFFAGPFVGILMSAKVSDGTSEDIKDNLKSTEFGASFGAGVAFPMTKGAITLDGRYDLGLSKTAKSDKVVDDNIKTGTISFFVGYNFK